MELTEYPTPRTNELIRTQLARARMTGAASASKLTFKCIELEREAAAWRDVAEMFAASNNHAQEAFDALKSQLTQP
jgi:hypothetical protein